MNKSDTLRNEILEKVKEYYSLRHRPEQCAEFVPGKTRVNYAGRVFDEKELVNLVDSSLEFWLTYGRYSREFETKLSEYLGVSWSLLVNSGSSANLLAFMALTSPLLKERQVNRGDEVIDHEHKNLSLNSRLYLRHQKGQPVLRYKRRIDNHPRTCSRQITGQKPEKICLCHNNARGVWFNFAAHHGHLRLGGFCRQSFWDKLRGINFRKF